MNDSDEMSREAFNAAVIDELDDRDREDLVEEVSQMDRNAHAMSSARVAAEEGLDRTEAAVKEVADARIYFLDVMAAQHCEDCEAEA